MAAVADSSALPQPAARRWRLMFFIFVIGGFLAAAWDGWWHITYEFDGFFSPPHVFAYLVATVVAWMVADTVFSARLRQRFGAGFRIPVLPYPIPGSLFILAAGMVMLGFAGLVLDNFWHSQFGLNETGWSFPHAMIGWSLVIILLGFISTRLALGKIGWGWSVLFGWLVAVMLIGTMTGPIGTNQSPDTVYARSQIPVLLSQEETQHLFRIYERYNLNRTNPLLILLAPLGGGAALAFLYRLDPRAAVFLGVALLLSLSNERNAAERLSEYVPGLLDNRANYAALPVIWMAGTFLLLRRLKLGERLAWAIAGVVFGVMISRTFGSGMTWLAIFSPVTALVGVALGEWLYRVVAAPTSLRTVLPLVGLGVLFPFVTGLIDLYMRLNTP